MRRAGLAAGGPSPIPRRWAAASARWATSRPAGLGLPTGGGPPGPGPAADAVGHTGRGPAAGWPWKARYTWLSSPGPGTAPAAAPPPPPAAWTSLPGGAASRSSASCQGRRTSRGFRAMPSRPGPGPPPAPAPPGRGGVGAAAPPPGAGCPSGPGSRGPRAGRRVGLVAGAPAPGQLAQGARRGRRGGGAGALGRLPRRASRPGQRVWASGSAGPGRGPGAAAPPPADTSRPGRPRRPGRAAGRCSRPRPLHHQARRRRAAVGGVEDQPVHQRRQLTPRRPRGAWPPACASASRAGPGAPGPSRPAPAGPGPAVARGGGQGLPRRGPAAGRGRPRSHCGLGAPLGGQVGRAHAVPGDATLVWARVGGGRPPPGVSGGLTWQKGPPMTPPDSRTALHLPALQEPPGGAERPAIPPAGAGGGGVLSSLASVVGPGRPLPRPAPGEDPGAGS